jgi:ribonucleoside-diphosphate reductase alpha chain
VSGFADAWAISVSWLLQLGVPLEDICKKYKTSRFEPAGLTSNQNIRFATSIIDYMVRWLEGRFVDPQMFSEEKNP